MGAEEIGIGTSRRITPRLSVVGQQVQHITDYLIGVVAILHTGPEVDLPADAPTRSHVAALQQRLLCRLEELRMGVWRYLVARIETVEVRYVAVLVARVVQILQPLLKLVVAPDAHRSQTADHTAQRVGIVTARAQCLTRPQCTAQRVERYLVVHRAARRDRDAVGPVLGRHRGCRHHPSVGRVFRQRREEEIGRALKYGIAAAQEIAVAREEVVLPQMLRQPRPAVGPHARIGIVHGARDTPKIGVVVRNPSARAVEFRGCRASRPRQLLDHAEQRLVRLREICNLGRPIVHLGVYVDRIFAVPRGERLAVPYTLQRCGLAAGLRRADQQIAPELKQQCRQRGIIPLVESRHATVRIERGARALGQRQLHTSELTDVLVAVILQQATVTLGRGVVQRRLNLGAGIARDIVVADEVRRRRYIYGCRSGIPDTQTALFGRHLTVRNHTHGGRGLQRRRHTLLLRALALDRKFITRSRNVIFQRARIRDIERQCPLPVGLQTHGHNIVRK